MTGSDRVRYHTTRETVPEDGRHHFDAIEASRGEILGPFAVLLNSPELAGRTADLGTYVRFESTLSDADRELAILTTAREFDCPYEWAMHQPIAVEAGVSDAALDVVSERRETDRLDDEAVVIEYGRELFGERSVSDETFDAAFDRYGERGVVELTATMGYYAMIACVLNAFEVRPNADQPQLH